MKEYIVTTEQGANQQFHELIRCKDCQYRKFVKYSHKEQEWGWYYCTRKQTDDPIITDDDDFCSWAERRDDESD